MKKLTELERISFFDANAFEEHKEKHRQRIRRSMMTIEEALLDLKKTPKIDEAFWWVSTELLLDPDKNFAEIDPQDETLIPYRFMDAPYPSR
mgnify:CR=1 FL=1